MKNILKITLFFTALFTLIYCSSDKEKTVVAQEDTIQVSVSQAESIDNLDFFNTSGKLIAKKSVNISTRLIGYITSFPVEVGQNVRVGQLLISINNTDIQAKSAQVDAQIKQAQTKYNIAKKDYERFQNLYNLESASQKELDDMAANYQMATAGLEAVKQLKKEITAQFKYTNITAPVSGVVTAKFAQQGDLANPGMHLLTIESSTDLQAQLMVSENVISQIKPEMEIEITVKSTNEKIKGIIGEISQSSTQTGGQYIVKADIQSSENLLPGMYVNARFPIDLNKNLRPEKNTNVIIPKSALVIKGQLAGIYIISDQNTSILRWIKTGEDFGQTVEVISGLKPGERYISSAQGRLYNGAKVSYN